MTDSTKLKRAPKRKRLRRVVERERSEYRGFFRLDERDRHGKPIHRTDKDGNPIYVYQLSWKDQNGNRKQKREHCHDDAEAQAKIEAYRTRVKEIHETGAPKTPTVETFAEFASREFLPHQKNRISPVVAKGRISATEYGRQEGIIDGHLIPHFGAMRLASIQVSDVIEYVNKRMSDTVRGGGKVSDGTILKERNVLRALLNLARAKKRIFENPASGSVELRPHIPQQPEGRIRYLTPDEWVAVFDACRLEAGSDGIEPVQWLQEIAALCLFLGTRRGELLAVTVPDIDLERSVVNLKKTKNGKRRAIPINEYARFVLEAMNIAGRQKKRDRRVLWPYADVTPENVSMRFIRACRRAGVEDFSLHDLRHSFASWQTMKGVNPRTLQELLGHSDPRMTARYSHLSPAHLADAVATLDGVFSLPGKPITIDAKALPAVDTTIAEFNAKLREMYGNDAPQVTAKALPAPVEGS